MFYIRLNGAYIHTWYWNRDAQNWTTTAEHATLFSGMSEARKDADRANAQGRGEAEICVRKEQS